jgi:hypothetical protein
MSFGIAVSTGFRRFALSMGEVISPAADRCQENGEAMPEGDRGDLARPKRKTLYCSRPSQGRDLPGSNLIQVNYIIYLVFIINVM